MAWAHKIQTPLFWSGTELKGDDAIAKNGYSSIVVQADATAAVKPLTTVLEKMDYGVISTQKELDRLMQFTTIMWVLLGAISVISLITAGLGIMNTMLMAVSEQRYSIGVWRAVGARKRTIAFQFLLQAALLGAVGGAVGAAAGRFIAIFINGHIQNLLKAQGLGSITVVYTPPFLLAGCLVMTIGFAVLAGLYPAWKAARQDPSKVLTSI
jgi:putative ABC transport system permease protein